MKRSVQSIRSVDKDGENGGAHRRTGWVAVPIFR